MKGGERETLLKPIATIFIVIAMAMAATLLPKPEPESEPESESELLHFKRLSPDRADENRRVASFLESCKKRKKGRSSVSSDGLHRVSSITPSEHVAFRRHLRLTRLLFSSLRANLPSSGNRRRSDLSSASAMNSSSLWLHRDLRLLGPLPGTRIGDSFLFRIELCVVGIHRQVQAGIDFLTSLPDPIATSVVLSGNYEDDLDNGDHIIYTGHGGRVGKNPTKQSLDQTLHGGNLALERSHHFGLELRVVRGFDCPRSPSGRLYVYDGLYRVADWWEDVGKSGYSVFKYKLVRLDGQPALPDPSQSRPGEFFLTRDLSQGKEKLPVAAFNDVDAERDVLMYDYLVCSTASVGTGGKGWGGCRCAKECVPSRCCCVRRNGEEAVYDRNGFLFRGKPLVYECGRHCRCSSSCRNRASQRGVTHRLEVFRSKETGWGVRSLDLIVAGEFICEFSGIVLSKQQAEEAEAKGRSLVYPGRIPRRWEEWGDLSMIDPSHEKPTFPPLPELDFVLDVSRARNVACYICHSSLPNVFVQFVLRDHYDMPRLMIFASENIPPMRELSLDYGVGDG